MSKWQFTRGLHDIGNGAYAYLQPDGGWGWSNAGLIVDADQSLLVDTLFDERLTDTMLRQIESATGVRREEIGLLVNTHANGDHTHGNALLGNAEIIASKASLEEMVELPPQHLAALLKDPAQLGEAGDFLSEIFSGFDFDNARGRLPTRTFCGEFSHRVGDKDVHLIEVGPAHTAGDVLVHVPRDKTVFTGDILFIDGTPIMWSGPVSNWLRACDRILAMDVDVIVPGHGPITDKSGVRQVQGYLRYLDQQARKCFDAGLSVEQAINEIPLGQYRLWRDCERIVVNVDTLYREYRGDGTPPNVMQLFALMGRFYKSQRRSRGSTQAQP